MADARARGCWRDWEAAEVRAEAPLTLLSLTHTLFSRSTHTPYPQARGMTLHEMQHALIPTAWLDGVPVTATGRAPRPPPTLVACERKAL